MNNTQKKIVGYLRSCPMGRASLKAIHSVVGGNYKWIAQNAGDLAKDGTLFKVREKNHWDKMETLYCLEEVDLDKPPEIRMPDWKTPPTKLGYNGMSEWDYEYGTAPGVFNLKSPIADYETGKRGKGLPAGSTCVWTGLYEISGFDSPEAMGYKLPDMTQGQLYFEALDILNYKHKTSFGGTGGFISTGNPALQEIAKLVAVPRPWSIAHRKQLEHFLAAMRPHLPRFGTIPWLLEPLIDHEQPAGKVWPREYDSVLTFSHPGRRKKYVVLLPNGTSPRETTYRHGWVPHDVARMVITSAGRPLATQNLVNWGDILFSEEWKK